MRSRVHRPQSGLPRRRLRRQADGPGYDRRAQPCQQKGNGNPGDAARREQQQQSQARDQKDAAGHAPVEPQRADVAPTSIAPSWSIPRDCAARSSTGTGCERWHPPASRPIRPEDQPQGNQVSVCGLRLPRADELRDARGRRSRPRSEIGRAASAPAARWSHEKAGSKRRARSGPTQRKSQKEPRAPAATCANCRTFSNVRERHRRRARATPRGSNCQSPRVQRCCARRGHVVARGILVDHLDIRGEAASRVNAFEQVVTEQAILADAIRQRGLERRRRRRFPCRCKSPRRTCLDRRPRRRTRKDRCRSVRKIHSGKCEASWPTGSDGVTRGCSIP